MENEISLGNPLGNKKLYKLIFAGLGCCGAGYLRSGIYLEKALWWVSKVGTTNKLKKNENLVVNGSANFNILINTINV